MLEQNGIDALCKTLVSASYVSQGVQELQSCSKEMKDVLSRRCLPKQGWSDAMIERLLSDLAFMDSNNFRGNAGVGEREGRVASALVARRHWNLAHGIGRSGDIAAEQPKAAGSSLMTRITHCLLQHALGLAGLRTVAAVQVYPVATGMTLTLAYLACAARRPDAKYVVWSRIDQKTCLKAIAAANLQPVVVPLCCGSADSSDELSTDMEAVAAAVARLGAAAVACVTTTTSCFAPRACDDVRSSSDRSRHSVVLTKHNTCTMQCNTLVSSVLYC
eukprot:jgi/Ulvmu1/878/UM100_0031.1